MASFPFAEKVFGMPLILKIHAEESSCRGPFRVNDRSGIVGKQAVAHGSKFGDFCVAVAKLLVLLRKTFIRNVTDWLGCRDSAG